mgnify:CR=1 FL=1
MQHEKEILCRYRLERAKEDLEAARVNHSSGPKQLSIVPTMQSFTVFGL